MLQRSCQGAEADFLLTVLESKGRQKWTWMPEKMETWRFVFPAFPFFKILAWHPTSTRACTIPSLRITEEAKMDVAPSLGKVNEVQRSVCHSFSLHIIGEKFAANLPVPVTYIFQRETPFDCHSSRSIRGLSWGAQQQGKAGENICMKENIIGTN